MIRAAALLGLALLAQTGPAGAVLAGPTQAADQPGPISLAPPPPPPQAPLQDAAPDTTTSPAPPIEPVIPDTPAPKPASPALPALPPGPAPPRPAPESPAAPAPPAAAAAPPAAPSQAAPAPLVSAPPPPNVWIPKPVADLVALDKVTARATTLHVHIGKSEKFGSLTIAVRMCDVRPPDQAADATAFLDITDSHQGGPAFHGWMLLSEPDASMLAHPIYDVRLAGCHE
jgi:hypothetical protein